MKKYKFNKGLVIYSVIFIFLITNFLLLIGLMFGGMKLARAQKHMAHSQMNLARMLGVISQKQQKDPLFQVIKDDKKDNKKLEETRD